jgi:hypothetical protein
MELMEMKLCMNDGMNLNMLHLVILSFPMSLIHGAARGQDVARGRGNGRHTAGAQDETMSASCRQRGFGLGADGFWSPTRHA